MKTTAVCPNYINIFTSQHAVRLFQHFHVGLSSQYLKITNLSEMQCIWEHCTIIFFSSAEEGNHVKRLIKPYRFIEVPQVTPVSTVLR